jgi:amino acid transporter
MIACRVSLPEIRKSLVKKAHKTAVEGGAEQKLGTFGGVFTPSVLTILGIILFLRLGFVVGSAGLLKALVIIAIANGISVLTSISLSAVATNLKVKGGGDYYLISRTLGVEFGGALGLVLFLAQSISIAFYCIGFGEVIAALAGVPSVTSQRVALLAVGLLFALAWMGADVATRFQYMVMAVLAGALASFYIGGIVRWDRALAAANWYAEAGRYAFWGLFAIFFPAVTGFTQGVSMSGELRDPARSLPLGTFMAVGISILVYFSVAIVFAGVLPLTVLSEDYSAMKRVAAWEVLIDAGVMAATLSSAMASFLGAPRILQALAADRVFPVLTFFEKGYGAVNNPRRAVVLSAVIALATVLAGSLNVVASIVSMFFLVSYGLLNYATFFESRTGSPSFRPSFRYFHQRLSLTGALACLGVMIAIDPVTGLLAVSLLFAVYQYLKRTAGPARWADSQRSYHLQQIREHLHGLAKDPEHPRDWRPHILALSNDPERRRQLLRLADWIAGRSGFTTAVRVMEASGGRVLAVQAEAEEELRRDIGREGFSAFPRVVCASDLESVLATVVQAHGIGPLRANTILLNWFSAETERDSRLRERMNHILRGAYRLGCNILISNVNERILTSEKPSEKRRIDIWWQGDATGRMSLLLAHIIRGNEQWENARLTVFCAEERYRSDGGREALAREIKDARIDADLTILSEAGPHALAERSAESDLVFLPFRFRRDEIISLAGSPAVELLRWLTSTVLIQAAEDIDLDAEPESGEAAERAEARDALEEAKRRADKAAKDAQAAAEKVESTLAKLTDLMASARDTGAVSEAERALQQARQKSEKATRRAAKASARRELAEKQAAELGAEADPGPEKDTE